MATGTRTTRPRDGAADWFKIDKAGLAQQLARKSKAFVAFELYQNAADTNTKRIAMTLRKVTPSTATITVDDDDPDGFKDLTHAYTLFAPSEKKADATKRGRFNIGEKLVLAICDQATVSSTKGTIRFDAAGRHESAERRTRGTCFQAVVRMDARDIAETERAVRTILVPAGITFTFNGETIAPRLPIRTFRSRLPSLTANEAGDMVHTYRVGTVALHEVREGERATIYELGIPVVEYDGEWHADVGQKVPLNIDRDNVTPAFLRDLRTAILDNAFMDLPAEAARSGWVKDALPRASDDAVKDVITKRYGEKAVAFDMSDPEGTKIAVAEGYTVVHGGSMSKGEWERVRELDLLKPAGQVTPSPAVLCGPDGTPPIPREEWTDAMRGFESYAKRLGQHLLGFEPKVEFAKMNNGKLAWYGGRTVTMNLQTLGKAWVEDPTYGERNGSGHGWLSLLIHEYSHELSSDHLSEEFHRATCRLGARMIDAPRPTEVRA